MITKGKDNSFIAFYGEHITALNELKNYENIQTILTRQLGLFKDFTFRNNTTTAFVDLIQTLKLNTSNDTVLVYSDIEHPCIKNCIEKIWYNRSKTCLNLSKYLLEGKIENLEYFLSNYERKDSNKVIFLFSHVVWHLGIYLNINKISSKIKERNPDSIIIIDGAQAAGNISGELIIERNDSPVDFYLTCTHKWIGTKNLLGLISINPKFLKSQFYIELMLGDIFSSFAGGKHIVEDSESTKNLLYLLTITKEVNKIKGHYNIKQKSLTWNDLLPLIISKYNLSFPSIPKNRLTKFTSVYGNYINAKDCQDVEFRNNSSILEDKALPSGNFWLRIDKTQLQ